MKTWLLLYEEDRGWTGRSGLNGEQRANLPLIGRFDLPQLYKGHAPPAGFVRFLVVVGEEKSLLHIWGGGEKEEAEKLT